MKRTCAVGVIITQPTQLMVSILILNCFPSVIYLSLGVSFLALSYPQWPVFSDPVFRAAMRGYDQVSFVFGLEVTWSLIQQRQQEEEEKQAMLELDNVTEIETAFDTSESQDENEQEHQDDEGDEPVTPESSIKNILEVDHNGADGPRGPIVYPNDSEEIKVPIQGADEDDVDIDESGLVDAKMEETEVGGLAEVPTETLDETTPFVDETLRERSPAKPCSKPEESWVCPQCTFGNKISRKTCEMCKFKGNSKRRKKQENHSFP